MEIWTSQLVLHEEFDSEKIRNEAIDVETPSPNYFLLNESQLISDDMQSQNPNYL